MLRRRTIAVVIAVTVAAAAVTALVVLRSDDDADPRAGSRVVETDPGFVIGSSDEPYRIVYRLGDLSDDRVATSIDEVWVRQPFESRLETSTGDELQGVQVSALDRLRFGTLDEPLVVARVPGLAVSDVRVAPVLDEAIDAGLFVLREQREIAGRRCQVVRSGTTLGAGPLVEITDAEHADSCIDGDGLLLEEILYPQGAPTLHRIATEVDTDPAVDDDLFETGEITMPADEGGGSSLPVDPEVGAVGPFWTTEGNDPPDGFERVGRYSVVPPQPERFAAETDPAIVAGVADVFVRDQDFVVVWQGGTVGRVDAYPPTPGAPTVDGGAVGDGELQLSALGSELRFPQPRGRFVHVIGTLASDELAAIARSLTETEGAGLVYL